MSLTLAESLTKTVFDGASGSQTRYSNDIMPLPPKAGAPASQQIVHRLSFNRSTLPLLGEQTNLLIHARQHLSDRTLLINFWHLKTLGFQQTPVISWHLCAHCLACHNVQRCANKVEQESGIYAVLYSQRPNLASSAQNR